MGWKLKGNFNWHGLVRAQHSKAQALIKWARSTSTDVVFVVVAVIATVLLRTDHHCCNIDVKNRDPAVVKILLHSSYNEATWFRIIIERNSSSLLVMKDFRLPAPFSVIR